MYGYVHDRVTSRLCLSLYLSESVTEHGGQPIASPDQHDSSFRSFFNVWTHLTPWTDHNADGTSIKGEQFALHIQNISPPEYPHNDFATPHCRPSKLRGIPASSFRPSCKPCRKPQMHRGHKIRQASSRCTSFIDPVRIYSTVCTECSHFSVFCWLFLFSSMDFIDDPAESSVTAVFEIPGVKTSDISLHIIDGHLVVTGERRPTYNTTTQSEAPPRDTAESGVQAPKLTTPIRELRFGTFRRAVQIPDGLKVRVPLRVHSQSDWLDFFK